MAPIGTRVSDDAGYTQPSFTEMLVSSKLHHLHAHLLTAPVTVKT